MALSAFLSAKACILSGNLGSCYPWHFFLQLFKLQRRFGGDKRFDLNERFLESDNENEVAEDDNHLNPKNNLVESKDSSGKHEEEEKHTIINLRQEKEMELKVLGSILGEDLSLGFGEKEFGEKNSIFRYCILQYKRRQNMRIYFLILVKKRKRRFRNEPLMSRIATN